MKSRQSRKACRRTIRGLYLEQLEARKLFVIGAFTPAPITGRGTGFDGVVGIDDGASTSTSMSASCTGALMASGRHILTAAHCVDFNGDGVSDSQNMGIVFDTADNAAGQFTIMTSSAVSMDSNYRSVGTGRDWAIITLPALAPFGANRYQLYRGNAEIGAQYTMVGYGQNGVEANPLNNGSLRQRGSNRWEQFQLGTSALRSDFDDGTQANNLFGDTGVFGGDQFEGRGDSGGPGFLNVGGSRQIAGIVSYGDTGFRGENVDTRVSSYAAAFDAVTNAAHPLVLRMEFQPAFSNNGISDNFVLRRNGTNIELFVNSVLRHREAFNLVQGIQIVGSSDVDRLTIDLSGGDVIPVGSIQFDGIGSSSGDAITVIGTTSTTIVYDPNAVSTGAGILNTSMGAIFFNNLGSRGKVQVQGAQSFTIRTQSNADDIEVGSVAVGKNEISGRSGGTSFSPVEFSGVKNVVIDAAFNQSSLAAATIAITSSFVATGLQTLTINTGGGDDTLLLGVDDFSLPGTLSTSAFRWNAGAGTGDRLVMLHDVDKAMSPSSGTAFFSYVGSLGESTVLSELGGGLVITGLETTDVIGGAASSGFRVESWAGPLNIFGGDGDDDLFLGSVFGGLLDRITGPITFEGEEGFDVVLGVDSGPGNYRLGPATLGNTLTKALPGGAPSLFGGLSYDSTTERLGLGTSAEPNEFDVTPDASTEYVISANKPTFTGPGVDYLNVNFAGTRGRKLTYSGQPDGNGKWEFLGQSGVGARKPIQFTSIEKLNYFAIVAVGSDVGATSQPLVNIYDAETGELQTPTPILAYESSYRQGVRVTTGDMNGDGIPELVTAPGRSRTQEVRVFNILSKAELVPFRTFAYQAARDVDGTNLAVGDVDGDGKNDIVTVNSRGTSEVRVFKNNFGAADPIGNTPIRRFLAFPSTFIGGSSIAVANILGSAASEIIVGSGSGMRATVQVFNATTFNATTRNPVPSRTYLPFETTFRGGVFVAAGDVNGDKIADIVIGAGQGGNGRVETLNGAIAGRSIIGSGTFQMYNDQGRNAAVRVTLRDTNNDGKMEIITGQGQDGRSRSIKRRGPLDPAAVDLAVINDNTFGGFFVG